MKRYRSTTGIHTVTGERLTITDDGLKPGNAHWLLKGSLTGASELQEVPEYIGETIAPLKI